MPKARHTAALLVPLSSAAITDFSFSASMARGRPPCRPRRLAAVIACSDPFLCQGPFVLGERPKDVEEQLAMGCGSVHLLGERSETDAFVP